MARGKPIKSSNAQEDRKYYCTCCGKGWKQQKTHFYMSRSPLFAANNKYIHICTDCLNIYYEQLLALFESDEAKVIEYICHQFDWYFNIKAFSKIKIASPDNTNMLGEYLRRKNTYSEGTYGDFYSDVIKERDLSGESPLIEAYATDEEQTIQVSQVAIDRWGSSFDPDEIKELETHYRMLKKTNPDINDNQEIFIKDLCTTKLLQVKALRDGNIKNYKDMTDLYSSMFIKAGLRAITDTDGSEKETYGNILALISQYTPEEYYKDKTLYHDADDIGHYYGDHVLRPLKNLQFGTNDRDKTYYVPDDESAVDIESGDIDDE